MAAPTTVEMLLWKIIVITDKAKLEALSAGLQFSQMVTDAGTGILVCVIQDGAALSSDFFVILDGPCVRENILLAAEALGLGAFWTAVFPDKGLMDFVRKKLGIPENVIPLNLIPVGYPNGDGKGRDKFDIKNIHWENW
jgi:nitroreductase